MSQVSSSTLVAPPDALVETFAKASTKKPSTAKQPATAINPFLQPFPAVYQQEPYVPLSVLNGVVSSIVNAFAQVVMAVMSQIGLGGRANGSYGVPSGFLFNSLPGATGMMPQQIGGTLAGSLGTFPTDIFLKPAPSAQTTQTPSKKKESGDSIEKWFDRFASMGSMFGKVWDGAGSLWDSAKSGLGGVWGDIGKFFSKLF